MSSPLTPRTSDILNVITANRPRPIDRNQPATPDPLWLDRTDKKTCTALAPDPSLMKLRQGGRPADPDRVQLTDDVLTDLQHRRERCGLSRQRASMLLGRGRSFISNLECSQMNTIDPDTYDRLLALYAGASMAEAA